MKLQTSKTKLQRKFKIQASSVGDSGTGRLSPGAGATDAASEPCGSLPESIGDLIGSVKNDGLPADLSSNKKKYLPDLIRAKQRPR